MPKTATCVHCSHDLIQHNKEGCIACGFCGGFKSKYDPEPDPAPDLTADLRTVLEYARATAVYGREGNAIAAVNAALDSGAVLVAPDAPLAQRLTEQERDDVRAVLGWMEQVDCDPDAPYPNDADARLRAALPTTGEER